jgi:CubicO group peptidase (beta-lactamase class C family)
MDTRVPGRNIVSIVLRPFFALVASLSAFHAAAASPATDHPPPEAIVDAAYASDGPGAAVIVVRDGKVLYRNARGLANLELGVPLHAEHVFRIGSVTKQFTAAAVLLLAEQGKLALSDPITRFLPEYPVQGHVVTVEHLLTHTSGIRNYTEIPEWAASLRRDVSVSELIGFFKDQPFDFAPGLRWKYDNSGYVLLGAIIEKVSGQPYAEFMRVNLFDPLGMTHTRYDDSQALVPGRVAGYMRDNKGWRNADYLSMSHPYAAGALLSTVDDLGRWNAAMENGSLLKPESWRRATDSARLPDGTRTRYGMGWIEGRVGPVATVEHGGGVLGFNAYVLRAPAQHLYIAVLANASPPAAPPQDVAVKLAASVLGLTLDAPELPIPARRLEEYAGRYAFEGGRPRTIARQGERLVVTEEQGSPVELVPIGRDLFEVRGSQLRYQFIRERGRVVSLHTEPRILMGERARRE